MAILAAGPVTVTPSTLVFTAQNYDTDQVFRFSAAEDANDPTHPYVLKAGSTVVWTYTVTNLTTKGLTGVKVVDDNGTPNDPTDDIVLTTPTSGDGGGNGNTVGILDKNETWVFTAPARTAGRPVASGRVSARTATAFGVLLASASFALLALTVNPLAAALSLSGFCGYVFVYTLWLKRTTPQNIVIGGAAGAVPPLVAWAAYCQPAVGTSIASYHPTRAMTAIALEPASP